jgi:2-oxoisovalerate dehydrogenase E1 component
MVPFGKANVVRPGRDLSIITYGALVRRSLIAAERAASDHGIEAEIIDLRSLAPWDQAAVAASIKKTARALVVYEDNISFGYGAEVAAWIADQVFEWLDAPVRRVASLDSPVAYAPNIEDEILPQTEDVLAAIRELAAY